MSAPRKRSTWFIALVPLALSLVIAFPTPFFPSAWTRTTTGGEYGITPREALRGLLSVLLVAETALALLYAAIRAGVQPAFRRDAGLIATAHVGLLALWVAALFVSGHR